MMYFKKSIFYFLCFALLGSVLFTSCGEDDPIIPDADLPPSVRLSGDAGFISFNTDGEIGTPLEFRIIASQGDFPIQSLTVYENGTKVDVNRLTYAHTTTAQNALLITGLDQSGFTYDLTIETPDLADVYTYRFEVTDTELNTDDIAVDISFMKTPPSTNLMGNSTVMASDKSSLVGVDVLIVRGSSSMSSLAVYEDGVLMDANRLRFLSADLSAEFTDNPLALEGVNKDTIDGSIYIRSKDEFGASDYVIEVIDESGESASLTVTIIVGESLDEEYSMVLVSNADGEEFGGLDLYLGDSVSVNSASANIVDLGVDINKVPALNWIQKIKSVNGAELRTPDTNQPELFNYDNITTKQALKGAYDSGITVSESDVVQEGDLFLVNNDDDYFLLLTTKVVVTENDNNDYYEFSIKQALDVQ